MPIEGFDYKGFATSMAEQARELVPPNLQDREKEYIVKTLSNFTLLAGEALYKNDENLNITAEQAVFITQIIAEWSFHKSIDLVHSGILPEYWDSIMQKIAFTIFEVAKQAIIRNIPQEQLLQAVEHHVIKVYKQSIEELQQKGVIDQETMERAANQSNIDEMAKQAQAAQIAEQEKLQAEQLAQQQATVEQAEKNREAAQKRREEKRKEKQRNASLPNSSVHGVTHKQLKMMSLALVLKILSQDKVTTILNKFDSEDSEQIASYMNMADLESHLDGDLIANCLKEIKDYLPIKRKLTKDNVLRELLILYRNNSRERVERVIRNERPLVKRFVAKSYDGEFSEIPLRVAGIVAQYIEDSI